MKQHLLKVDSIIKYYGHRQLLSNVFFTCQTNQVVGILGRNGCGKSTLLKIVFGTEKVNHKYVAINGEVYPQAFKYGKQMAYLPQHPFLPPRDFVKHIIRSFIPKPKDCNSILQDPHVFPHLSKKINALSRGESRYLEILLLLHLDVKFVLLDEPFSGIAPQHKEAIKDLLLLHKHHKGILITDHDYRNILEISDYLLLIHDGHCKHIKDRAELVYWGYLPEEAV